MKVVIKLGGSVFIQEGLNKALLIKLVTKLKEWSTNHEIAVVVGAGELNRKYADVCREFTKNEDLVDLFGIHVARMNASILIAALDGLACDNIPRSEEEFLVLAEKNPSKIIIAGGFRPKQRTDAVAVEIAKAWGADLVIKGTNVDYVFDKDPNKSEDAKPIKEISYAELEKMVNVGEFKAASPTIMDRTAAGILVKEKIKVVILNGSDLENIGKVLAGEDFNGTKVGF